MDDFELKKIHGPKDSRKNFAIPLTAYRMYTEDLYRKGTNSTCN